MKELHPAIRAEYERWAKQFAQSSFDSRARITVDRVLRAHFLIVDHFISADDCVTICGPRKSELLLSAVDRQTTGYGGVLKWSLPLEQAATLFFGLIKNHPFHDGNKRTALLVLLYDLLRMGQAPEITDVQLEDLAVRTASNDLGSYARFANFREGEDAEVRFLADYLRRNTRQLNKKKPHVTFRVLDRVLRQRGFGLENASGNYIDVVRFDTQIRGLFKKTKESVTKKLTSIGFPRWTAEVSPRDLKNALRAAELTPEHGHDADVLFGDAEQLETLIVKYHRPLSQLKDK